MNLLEPEMLNMIDMIDVKYVRNGPVLYENLLSH